MVAFVVVVVGEVVSCSGDTVVFGSSGSGSDVLSDVVDVSLTVGVVVGGGVAVMAAGRETIKLKE